MTASTKKMVCFAQLPPRIDKTCPLPHCPGAEYVALCAQIKKVFEDYKGHSKKFPRPSTDHIALIERMHLDFAVRGILPRVDTLPDQNDLSRRILRVVTSQIGFLIYVGFDCQRAWAYWQIALENQTCISQTYSQIITPSNGVSPWWGDLEKHWTCFFTCPIPEETSGAACAEEPNKAGCLQDLEEEEK